MRGEQLARQWQLIQRLARSRADVALDDLAEDLAVVRRTVYRDLDALMLAGSRARPAADSVVTYPRSTPAVWRAHGPS